jgi:hypothetical protein
MVQWFNGSMVQWFNGSMVQWFNGSMSVTVKVKLCICSGRADYFGQ